ncbi:MAG: ABC transporter substrate-binding protein, partial [Acidimicrobiales bacterium]
MLSPRFRAQGRRPFGRRFRLLAVAAVAALVAAGCGSDEEGASDAAGDANLAGQTVTVAGLWTGAEQANFQQVLDEFSRRTGAATSYTSTGDNIAAVLGARVQGGNPPDVALLPQPGLLRDFAKQGALVALPAEVRSEVEDSFTEVWRDLGSVDGQLYGVFFKAANKSLMWNNTRLLEQAGVRQPETWPELLQAARTIAAYGVAPVSIGGADGWTLTDWFENVYLRTAGPERYDQLANRQLPWTDQSVKDALARLAEMWGDPALVSGGAATALQTTFPESVVRVFADPPQAAIVFEGDFVAGVVASETNATVGEEASYFTFPSIGGSPRSVVTAGDVAVMMRDT